MRMFSPRLAAKVSAAMGAQAVPIGGVLGGWSPATGLALYWVEAMLGALLAIALVWLYRRRISDPTLDAALGPPGSAEVVAARDARLADLERAKVRPRDIALVHGAGFLIFGGFFAGILLILSQNHGVPLPSAAELRQGLPPLAGLALFGFLLDLPGLGRRPASFVAARVNAGTSRWGILWGVGFFGTILMVVTGRPLAIFLVFAALKTLFEVGAALERVIGQKPGDVQPVRASG